MKAVFILLVTIASAFAGYDAEYFKKDYEPGFQHVWVNIYRFNIFPWNYEFCS